MAYAQTAVSSDPADDPALAAMLALLVGAVFVLAWLLRPVTGQTALPTKAWPVEFRVPPFVPPGPSEDVHRSPPTSTTCVFERWWTP
jgi:hypothetical protein